MVVYRQSQVIGIDKLPQLTTEIGQVDRLSTSGRIDTESQTVSAL